MKHLKGMEIAAAQGPAGRAPFMQEAGGAFNENENRR
jgi:hypothetical protein